ncbi:hypothetical protein ACHAWT_002427 [Skeletonema menzelii]
MTALSSNYLRWMSPSIGDTFPDLQGETQHTDSFSLYEYLGNKSWGVVFMHPGDFTPVCTTELGAAQSLKAEFYARGTKLCGFSCDDANCHRAWVADIEAATGQRLDFPLFCDPDRKHAIELGVFDPQLKNDVGLPQTVRSVFILKPDKTIALTMTYPPSVGRNFDEILRVLDALQREWNFGVNTPANWQPGDRTIVPYNMNDEQAEEIFGKNGFIAVDLPSERGKDIKKHYLRYADDPILTDTTNKQSTKLSSRIGKIKSWKPPKSFLPFAGSLSSTSMRRRRNTSGRKSQLTPVSSTEKDSGIEKNECKIKSELDLKQNVSVSDDNKHNNWKQFLSVGLSALKSEIVEHQGTKQPDSKESGTDDSQSEKDRECRERRRFSRNSAGSEVVW